MALLSLKNLTIEFPGVRALDDVSIDFESGEIHALCGENGAGKSTLIKVIAGVWPCSLYSGDMLLDNKIIRFHSVKDSSDAAIQVIYQEMSLANNLSVAHNIFLGHEPRVMGLLDSITMYKRSKEILKKLETDIRPETIVSELTIGQQQIVEIAKALSKKARIMIFDEPTAALPEHEVEVLFSLIESLKAEGISIIYISHKLNEIRQLADKVTVLRNGKVISHFTKENIDMPTVVRDMIGRSLDKVYPVQGKCTNEVLLKLDDVTLTHRGKDILKNISLECKRGEVLGIAGLLGAGRTALFSLIYGVFKGSYTGKLFLNGTPFIPSAPSSSISNGVVLVTEDRKKFGLITPANVERNMTTSALSRFCSNAIIDIPQALRECSLYVDKLKIKTPSLAFKIANLSGGNQQKVILSRFLMVNPKLILLDDPTRGVDVGAKQEIYALIHQLAAEGIGILFASSELPEVLGVAHRVLVLQGGGIKAEYMHGTTNEEEVLGIAAGVDA